MGIQQVVFRLAAPALAGLALTACITVAPTLQTTPSVAAIGERKPLEVAIVVPEAVRGFNQAHEIPGRCLPGGMTFAPTPYGQQLATTVEDRFKRVFESVAMIDSAMPRDRYDAVFEIGISDVGFQFGCLVSPQQMGQVTGSFRAVDPDGRELWRSPTTVGAQTTPFAMVFDPGTIIGSAVSQATGKLADNWAREVAGLQPASYFVFIWKNSIQPTSLPWTRPLSLF